MGEMVATATGAAQMDPQTAAAYDNDRPRVSLDFGGRPGPGGVGFGMKKSARLKLLNALVSFLPAGAPFCVDIVSARGMVSFR